MNTAAAVLWILGVLYVLGLLATCIVIQFAPEGRETEDGFERVSPEG